MIIYFYYITLCFFYHIVTTNSFDLGVMIILTFTFTFRSRTIHCYQHTGLQSQRLRLLLQIQIQYKTAQPKHTSHKTKHNNASRSHTNLQKCALKQCVRFDKSPNSVKLFCERSKRLLFQLFMCIA